VGTKHRYGCFFALFRDDRDPDLAFLYIENSVPRIALGKDGFVFLDL
jgi:hypothetical protein